MCLVAQSRERKILFSADDINDFLNQHISTLNLFSTVSVFDTYFFPFNVTLTECGIHTKSNSEFVFRTQDT